MSLTTKLLRQAVTELRDAVQYHELERVGRGAKLRREVRTEIAMLTETPSIGAPAHEFADGRIIRRRTMSRFPYSIVYLVDARDVVVLAIAHTRRRPGYWLTRVK